VFGGYLVCCGISFYPHARPGAEGGPASSSGLRVQGCQCTTLPPQLLLLASKTARRSAISADALSEAGRTQIFKAIGGRMMPFLAGAGDGRHARDGQTQRGAAAQRGEMFIGYNEMRGGDWGRLRLVWDCFNEGAAAVDALVAYGIGRKRGGIISIVL